MLDGDVGSESTGAEISGMRVVGEVKVGWALIESNCDPCCRRCWSRNFKNCPIPEPIQLKAGMSSQNHQISPAGANPRAANETNKKPSPVKKLLTAPSMLGGFLSSRRLSLKRPLCLRCIPTAPLLGNCPSNACEIRLTLAPHERQYFWVSSI
jgi:hypothetical protein